MHERDDRPQPTQPTDQRAAWNGPEGANWAALAAKPVPDGDFVAEVLAAATIAPEERVLDIGCGTGDLTIRAARVATGGSAIGVDLSKVMIAQARATATAAGLGNITFEVGDVQTHPFADGDLDVAVSHFGVMFFDDPTAAFANVARALRPGGRLVFACPAAMERCDWYFVPLSALHGRRPSADEVPSAMFSLSDLAELTRMLERAGFAGVVAEDLPGTFWFGPDPSSAADVLLGAGPIRAFLEQHPDVAAPDARDTLAAALAPSAGGDGVRLPGAHRLVRAERAGGRIAGVEVIDEAALTVEQGWSRRSATEVGRR